MQLIANWPIRDTPNSVEGSAMRTGLPTRALGVVLGVMLGFVMAAVFGPYIVRGLGAGQKQPPPAKAFKFEGGF